MGEPKRGHGVVLSSFVLSSFEGYAEEMFFINRENGLVVH